MSFNLPELKLGRLTAKIPIMQGGMSIRVSTPPLCAAVSNTGAIGILGSSGIPIPEVKEQIREMRLLSPNGLIGSNIMAVAKEFMETVEAAHEAGADFIITGAGFSREVFKYGQKVGLPIVSIVSSAKAAVMAEKCGASAIVVEGKEAGGHLGTDRSIWDILPEVLAAVDRKMPVLPAGGITNGHEIRKAIEMGSAGVQIATIFMLATECTISDRFKQYLLNVKKEDVVIIKSPVGMSGRAVLNPFSRRMFNGSKDLFERCKVQCMKYCDHYYCIVDRLIWAAEGDTENGLMFTGENVWKIKSIEPAAKIIQTLVAEAENN